MDQIRDWLFIGKYNDTQNMAYLRSKSINAMLQLADEVEIPGMTTLFLPVSDFEPLRFQLLRRGLDFIHQQRSLGRRTLIVCAAGINRSSTYCIAALKQEEGLSLLDAFKEVKRAHPESMPHEPIWVSLCNYFEEKVSYLEIMRFQP